MQLKVFGRSVNMASQTYLLSRLISIISTMERGAFWVLKPLIKSPLISQKIIFKKIIDLILQTPFVNF